MTRIAAHERVVVELARHIHDGDLVILGSFTPVAYAATLLAQRTHAPRLDHVAYGYFASRIERLGFLGVEGQAVTTGYGPIGYEELVGSLRFGGLVAVEPVRPAQVDGRGFLNLRWIRRSDGTAVRLPGTAGAAEVLEMHRRPLGYLPEHSLRTCVGRVDDDSLVVHPPSARREAFRLVTELGVLERSADGWTVVSRHPGVTSERLVSLTGFPLRGAGVAPNTPEPDPEVLDLLRTKVDPFGVARTEFLRGADRLRLLERVLTAEETSLLYRDRSGRRAADTASGRRRVGNGVRR